MTRKLSLALFLAAICTTVLADGRVALTPPQANAPQGRAITLSLELDFAVPTLGGAVNIMWNASDYQLERWQPQPVGDPLLFQPGEPLPDRIENIVVGDPRGIANRAVFGTLVLRALDNGPQPVNVTLAAPFLSAVDGQPLTVSLEAAVVNVGPPEFDPAAETLWRHVARVNPNSLCPVDPNTGCPQTSSWTGETLFEASPGGSMPPALADFCTFELGNLPTPAQLDELAQLLEDDCVDSLAPDRLVVVPMGATQLADALGATLRADFLDQAGQPDGVVTPLTGGVRLAIVDTQPDALSPAGNSPHGFALRAMARELLCPGGACAIDIRTALALPMLRCDTDPREVCRDDVLGGYLATQSQLAAAIRTTTIDWLATAPTDRLVMNLSVAWHPRFGADPSDGPSVEAVFLALEDARCRGALVVASAGNRINEPDPFPPADPLLPAAWERFSMPDLAACTIALEALPVASDFPTSPDQYAPLVFAAGAVAADLSRVSPRVLGEPRLVAFGDHAVAEDDALGVITQVQTGTSPSALVVSAAVAAVWSQDTASAPHVVSELVYAASTGVGREASVFDSACPTCDLEARRVRVCEAAAFACDAFENPSCTLGCAGVALPVPRPLPIDTIATTFVADNSVSLGMLTESFVPDVAACGERTLFHAPGEVPDSPCPEFLRWGIQAQPYVSGQPSSQPCEACTGRGVAADLFVEIAEDFVGTLSHVTLGCGTDAFRLPAPGGLVAGDTFYISDLPTPCDSPRLAYSVTEPGDTEPSSSVISTLLIDAGDVTDSDGDAVPDVVDNCAFIPNADQLDTDGDLIGNLCDADIAPAVNDCVVNVLDLAALRIAFFQPPDSADYNPDADFNGDDIVNVIDLGLLRAAFFAPPGPSGIAGNACAGQ